MTPEQLAIYCDGKIKSILGQWSGTITAEGKIDIVRVMELRAAGTINDADLLNVVALALMKAGAFWAP